VLRCREETDVQVCARDVDRGVLAMLDEELRVRATCADRDADVDAQIVVGETLGTRSATGTCNIRRSACLVRRAVRVNVLHGRRPRRGRRGRARSLGGGRDLRGLRLRCGGGVVECSKDESRSDHDAGHGDVSVGMEESVPSPSIFIHRGSYIG
jgi:hypothetical protein